MQRTDTPAAARCRSCQRVRPMAGHDAKIALVER
jgi:hypothetical protein